MVVNNIFQQKLKKKNPIEELIQKPEPEVSKKPEPEPEVKPKGTDVKIKFNPDKSVNYEAYGISKNLTSREYSALMGKEGDITPNVQELQHTLDIGRIQKQRESKKREEVIGRLLDSGLAVKDITPQLIQQELNKPIQTGSEEQQIQPIEKIQKYQQNLPTGQKIMANMKEGLSPVERIKNLPYAVPISLNILSNFQKTLTGADTPMVTDARAALDTSIKIIDDNYKNALVGKGNIIDTKMELNKAAEALNVMEANVHGKGLSNLRYRLRGSMNLETEIRLKKQILQQYIDNLNAMPLA